MKKNILSKLTLGKRTVAALSTDSMAMFNGGTYNSSGVAQCSGFDGGGGGTATCGCGSGPGTSANTCIGGAGSGNGYGNGAGVGGSACQPYFGHNTWYTTTNTSPTYG
jgi:hypothetical protein